MLRNEKIFVLISYTMVLNYFLITLGVIFTMKCQIHFILELNFNQNLVKKMNFSPFFGPFYMAEYSVGWPKLSVPNIRPIWPKISAEYSVSVVH